MRIKRIALPGQKVPAWLESVGPTSPDPPYKKPELTFCALSVVYVSNNRYVCRPLISSPRGAKVFRVSNGLNCTIRGQSPRNDGTPVVVDIVPFMTYGEVILLTLVAFILTGLIL